MKKRFPTIALTLGEPAGIGPEIAVRAAWQKRFECNSVLIGDIDFLRRVAHQIDPTIVLHSIANSSQITTSPDELSVIHVPLNCEVTPGKLDVRNGLPVLASLDVAIDGAMQKRFDAIVTGPLQKSTINDAGVSFSGHTEYLAAKTHTKKVVMMLAGRSSQNNEMMRVALVTTHMPLRDVANAISVGELIQIIHILDADLKSKFKLKQPVILVTGLNPHAGEQGYLGREEIDVIEPAIAAAKARGIDVRGPYPADTLFQDKYLKQADCVLAMYHDQGLPVLKYASFGLGVNITLGLPIIRTSVDHGTALDVAAKGIGHADAGSMLAAIQVAMELIG